MDIKKALFSIVAVIIILSVVLYYMLSTQRGAEQIVTTPTSSPTSTATSILQKKVNLTILTTWTDWACTDFSRYFFAESGMRGGMWIRPSASEVLGINNLSFIRSFNLQRWYEYLTSGTVDGFIGGPPLNATQMCRMGGFAPIEDPELLKIAEQLPANFKGYTPDGKLCWIAVDFGILNGILINVNVGNKYGLPNVTKWADFLNPVYTKPLIQAGIYPIQMPRANVSDEVFNMLQGLLQKYGWNDGWVIATAVGALAKETTSGLKARQNVVLYSQAYATVSNMWNAIGMLSVKGAAYIVPEGETIVTTTVIAIAKNAPNKEKMVEFIKWYLGPVVQGDMYLNRTGWNNQPVLPPPNRSYSPYLIYGQQALARQNQGYDPQLANETDPIVRIYFDAVTMDKDVKDMLTKILKYIGSQYFDGKMSAEEYQNWLKRIGSPLTFVNPLTGEKTTFTLDVAINLNKALQTNSITQQDLYNAFKNAMIERLTAIMQELGIS